MAQMLIRPPDNLKLYIQEEAGKMGITINALILQILWEWVKQNESRTRTKN